MKIDSARVEQIREILLKEKQARQIETTNRYETFRISFHGGLIIGYSSGKLVITGNESRALVTRSIQRMGFDVTGFDITIGSDEAGKGEWLGPMVAAAVALTPEQSTVLRSLGVMDSKALSQTRIAELKDKVTQNATALKTVLVSPPTFNKRVEDLHREGKNLNDMLAWAHAKVISAVHAELRQGESGLRIRVVIDEFSKLKTEDRLGRVLQLDSVELIQRPRAEDEIAVAAASIVARGLREEWIDDKSRRLGIDLRVLTVKDAVLHSDAGGFAKISYLRKLATH